MARLYKKQAGVSQIVSSPALTAQYHQSYRAAGISEGLEVEPEGEIHGKEILAAGTKPLSARDFC